MRLVSGFAGRTAQIAAYFPESRPSDDLPINLLEDIFHSILGPKAIERSLAGNVGYVVFHCVKVGAFKLAEFVLREANDSALHPALIASAWFGYGLAADLGTPDPVRADRALTSIMSVYKKKEDDVAARAALAMELYSRMRQMAPTGDSPEAGRLIDVLRGLQQTHQNDRHIRKQLAMALFNLANDLADTGDLEGAGNLLSEMRKLHQAYPDDAAIGSAIDRLPFLIG